MDDRSDQASQVHSTPKTMPEPSLVRLSASRHMKEPVRQIVEKDILSATTDGLQPEYQGKGRWYRALLIAAEA